MYRCHSVEETCSPHLETLSINCKPFNSSQGFSSFILVGVYIPPRACVSEALQHQITDMEQKHPDSLLVVLGDFNRANLSHELPKYRQHIKCPTRDTNILGHCYTVIKNTYRSVPPCLYSFGTALGLSDHCLVHLIPTSRQKLKSAKPVIKTVRRWTDEAKPELQSCFDCTDWSVFETAATDLDELTDTVTLYISFCEDMCVPTSWFTAKLRQLRQAKEEAYRSGDRVLYNQARNTLMKEIRVAKKSYTEKLKNKSFFLLTGQTGQWMMQSTWDCTTSCNTSTLQGHMRGSC